MANQAHRTQSRARRGLDRISARSKVFFLLLSVAYFAAPGEANAQRERSYPGSTYYGTIEDLYRADYNRAERGFKSEARGGYRSSQGVWIDAICYRAMLGETYYQMGQYDNALASFNSAIEIYLAHHNWMVRLQFQGGGLKPDATLNRKATPWGRSSRNMVLGNYPRTVSIGMGRITTEADIRRGGAIQQARFMLVDAVEVVRCTSLAIRRRNEIMGPLSPHAPNANDLVAKLRRRPGLPNHWSRVWIDLELGLAQVGAGDAEQAKPNLQRAVLAGGQFHHPLSAVAMVELGRLALRSDNLAEAAALAEEAIYSAYYFEDILTLKDAMRLGFEAHVVKNRNSVYPPLTAGIAWAKRERYRDLEGWLLLMLAENHVALGQPNEAAVAMRDMSRVLGRRNAGGSVLSARASYVTALVAANTGKSKIASQAITQAIAHAGTSSIWGYQIALADGLYRSGGLTTRQATSMYPVLLRDPNAKDWLHRPYESLAVLSIPHTQSFENWFDAAFERKDQDDAIEIADAARRHRFFSSLPLGGRVLSLRTLLETPADQLPQVAALQVQDLNVRYPGYRELSNRDQEIRRQIRNEGLMPEDQTASRKQVALLKELARISADRENILEQIALRREPAAMLFPPPCQYETLVKGLEKDEAMLVFFSAGGNLYGQVLSGRGYRNWKIKAPANLRKKVSDLLRSMGNVDATRELELDTLKKNDWKEKSSEVWKAIFAGSGVDPSRDIAKLIIVPDDFLWYLPFEALIHPDKPDEGPLVAQVQIRYAPTAALGIPSGVPIRRSETTALVLGKLFPRDDAEVSEQAFKKLSDSVPGPLALRNALPAPSPVFGAMIDDLIVWDDIPGSGPFNWSPIAMGRSRTSQGTLADWISLPWGGPQRVILPGFHTPAETAMRRRGPPPNGQELFLSTCGLMASGARTILISRWRVGGETSLSLVNDFVQDITSSSPASAWRQSILLSQTRELDRDKEPRLRKFEEESPPLAEHPFFWAGYLLIDDGTSPVEKQADEDKQGPVIPFKAGPGP